MDKWRNRGIALAALALIGAAPAPPDPSAPFQALRLSAELARMGTDARDPLLLLAAARLRRSVGAHGDDDRVGDWLSAAERLGAADPRVAGLAADVRAELRKGRAAGPRVSTNLIRAGEQRRFSELFRAGVPAVVYVEGDGDSDLTLVVGGSRGIACNDASAGDVKLCAWTPQVSEPVSVEVANVGPVQNRFILGTN